jgi:hypothetical protein
MDACGRVGENLCNTGQGKMVVFGHLGDGNIHLVSPSVPAPDVHAAD